MSDKDKENNDGKENVLKYDVLVIGGGPGGYVAAIRAAQLGLKVACIEKWINQQQKPALGGTCLNVGCIPSKALLESSEFFEKINTDAENFGINVNKSSADIPAIIARKDKIVSELTSGIAALFKANKIDWIPGTAKELTATQVAYTDHEGTDHIISGENIIIATGSVPIELKQAPLHHDIVVDSEGALNWQKVPKELCVIGAGVIGLELGSVWSRLGANVTILEGGDFLPTLDKKISKTAHLSFKRQGLNILTSSLLQKMSVVKNKVQVIYQDANNKEHQLNFDKAIVAVGRRAFTDHLLATDSEITLTERGQIEVDDYCATNLPRVYAIGDAVRGPMLAHKASEEGVMVAERIAGQKTKVDYKTIPFVIYTHPEIAWVGQTEAELNAIGVEYNTGEFPFAANGRAKAGGDTVGFIKLIADSKTDRILGAHMIGPKVSELIAQVVIAMEFEGSAEDLARTIFGHPSLSEALHEAALAVDKRALHSINK